MLFFFKKCGLYSKGTQSVVLESMIAHVCVQSHLTTMFLFSVPKAR